MRRWTASLAAALAVAALGVGAGAGEDSDNVPTVTVQPGQRTLLGTPLPKDQKDVKPAVCPICGKPYHLHAEDGFECVPRVKPGERIVRVHYADARCPVCGLEFKGPLPGGWGRRAIYDRDFCIHSPGTEVVFCSSWLCVRCGYAAPYVDFNRDVDDEVKKFVREKISPSTFDYIIKNKIGLPKLKITPEALPDIVTMRDLPEIMIYSSAIEVEKHRSPTPERMAKLYVEASHACRRAVCSTLNLTSINLSKQIRGLDDILSRDGEAVTDPGDVIAAILIEFDRRNRAVARGKAEEGPSPQMKYVMYLRLAGACDRVGDSRSAQVYMDKTIEALSDPAPRARPAHDEMRDIATKRRNLMEREAAYQAAAVRDMKLALERGVYKGQTLLQTVYMIGELSRRIADFPRAVAWLKTADALCQRGTKLSQWIGEALSSAQLKGVTPGADDAELLAKVLAAASQDSPAAKEPAAEPEAPEARGEPEAPEKAPAAEAPEAPAPEAEAPAGCREAMGRIHKALGGFHEAKGAYPERLDELAEGGFISRQAAGGFRCPATGSRYVYRRPKGPDDDGIILFHTRPGDCACKMALKGGGEVIEIGK